MTLNTSDVLEKGMQAFKSGDLQSASELYNAVLKIDPYHSEANYNLGLLYFETGEITASLSHFKTAIKQNSKLTKYRISYISALIALNRYTEAKSELFNVNIRHANIDQLIDIKKRLNLTNEGSPNIQNPPKHVVQNIITMCNMGEYQNAMDYTSQLLTDYANSNVLYNICGVINRSTGMLTEAVNAYKKAIFINPNYAHGYNNLGNAFKDIGERDKAVLAFEKAIELLPNVAQLRYNLGLVLSELQKHSEAVQAYTKAISLDPNLAVAYNDMGISMKEQGKINEAKKSFEQAVAIKPDFYVAINNLGNILKIQSNFGTAFTAYKKAVTLKPTYTEAWLNGAETLEKWNKLDQLENWLEEAFNAHQTISDDLKFMKARCHWRRKRYAQAYSIVSEIKLDNISEIRKPGFLSLSARCFERKSEFSNAFFCIAEKNQLLKNSSEFSQSQSERYLQSLKNDLANIEKEQWYNTSLEETTSLDFSPTFLVGFPRSGTTLLDSILRSHSQINVVEEQPILNLVQQYIREQGHTNLVSEPIPNEVRLKAQKIYEMEFERCLEHPEQKLINIDKLPLNLVQLPLIRAIYPNCKIILALRHPMDTVLSCWMQNFNLNAAMANMLDLQNAVDFYCVAMNIFMKSRKKSNLLVHEIRYEDLVGNFQSEVTQLLAFLNLTWEQDLQNFNKNALQRSPINTPSYSQVVQPIYNDAVFRWKKYRNFLDEYTESLKPWIEEFGYD